MVVLRIHEHKCECLLPPSDSAKYMNEKLL